MQKTRLLEVFRSFDRQELRRLRDFVKSPFFNKNQVVISLCEEMIDLARRGFPAKSTETEAIFTKVLPGKTFDEKQFSYISSDLLKLCERFLSLQTFHQDNYSPNIFLLKACHHRGLEKSFQKHYQRGQKLLKEQKQESIGLLYQRFQFSQLAEDRFLKSGDRRRDPFLQQVMDKLDNYYFTQKLRLSCMMLTNQSAFDEAYTLRFLSPEIITELPQLPNSHLARLYALSYQLMQQENDVDALQIFLVNLRKWLSKIESESLNELFHIAINYCIRQIRNGHRYFTKLLFELYQECLEESYLVQDGVLSPWDYKNMITLGLGLGQLDWVQFCVENYTQQLPEEAQSDAYHFNMADISYNRKHYDEALHFLQKTEFTDIHYTLKAKVMLIKIFYETEETEVLLSLLSSFHLFLLRNKLLSQGMKEVYLKFISFTKRIQRTRKREVLENLVDRIETASQLSDRSWLLKQVSQKIDLLA